MTDQREAILARLLVLAGSVTGVASAARNRLDVSKLQRPAVVIFDGAEQLASEPEYGRGVVRSEIQKMLLRPVISVHVRGDGGALLSLYRARLLTAILNDAALIDAVSVNGGIRYEAAEVLEPSAEGSEYRMDLAIGFTYIFRLSDLT
jgi:hypothetical protein